MMKCIKPVVVIFFLLIIVSAHAQNQFIDSLKGALKTTREDTSKVLLLHQIAWGYCSLDAAKGLPYAKQALELADRIKWQKGIALAKESLGRIHWRLGNFSEAVKLHNEALNFWKEKEDKKKQQV